MTVATTAQSHGLRIGATLSGPNAQTESREKDVKSKYRRQWEAEKLKG